MTVSPIDPIAPLVPDGAVPAPTIPDAALPGSAARVSPSELQTAAPDPADLFTGLVAAFRAGDRAFTSAQSAENAVIAGHGDIQTMIFERARADAMLQIASGAASHLAQSLNMILQMQV